MPPTRAPNNVDATRMFPTPFPPGLAGESVPGGSAPSGASTKCAGNVPSLSELRQRVKGAEEINLFVERRERLIENRPNRAIGGRRGLEQEVLVEPSKVRKNFC